MTTDQAVKMLGASSANALASILGISHQAVFDWHGKVPEKRAQQVRLLAREKVEPSKKNGK